MQDAIRKYAYGNNEESFIFFIIIIRGDYYMHVMYIHTSTLQVAIYVQVELELEIGTTRTHLPKSFYYPSISQKYSYLSSS